MHVLITRPIHQAHITAAHLERMGIRSSILPLVRIVPLEFSIPAIIFDAIIATSANIFSAAQKQFAAYRHLPLFCVGEHTAMAAKQAGFTRIAAITEDANTLALLCKSHTAHHFLYLAGLPRRPVLEQEMAIFGKKITVVEVYQQQPLFPREHDLAMMPPRFDYALFYSAVTAEHAGWLEMLFDQATQFLCLSPRIAQALPEKFHMQARSATHPREACLLAMI